MKKPEKRYLALVGCIFEINYYRDVFQKKLEDLKRKHFRSDPDEPVILHRKEIINKSGPFHTLKNPVVNGKFGKELLDLFETSQFEIISVVIDKYAHHKRYTSPFNPYHHCLSVMLERYCIHLKNLEARGDVLAESRGGKEDLHLKEAYGDAYNNGTPFISAESFKKAFTSCEIKIKPKSKNIAGLQFADLLAHPIKQDMLLEEEGIGSLGKKKFGGKVCNAVKDKHCKHSRSGKIKGCGKIFLKYTTTKE